jgi:two-component sensor histidine kinase/ABC-type amino acid transport substrate-binding protein
MLLLIGVFAFLLLTLLPQAESNNGLHLTAEEVSWLDENEIRFAPTPYWPPVDFLGEQGEHRGISADYIRLFEKKLGKTFHMVQYGNWSEVLDGLKSGEIDFAGVVQKTDDRAQYLLFTDPVIHVPNVILTRSDYPSRVSQSQLSSMTLAGASGYANVDHVRRTYPGAEIMEYDFDLMALLETSLGNIDGAIIDLLSASYLVDRYGITNLKLGMTLDYAWELRVATRKDLPELHAILSKLVASVDEGQREEIFRSWVNIDIIREASFLERYQTRLILLFSVVLFVAVAFTYHNFHLKRQVKKHTRALEATLKEKDILLSEINHRVNNNLAITSSLLQLEMMQANGEEVWDIFSNTLIRIKSIALVHETLYKTQNFENFPFHMYLEELTAGIAAGNGSGKQIQVKKELREVFLNLNLAIPAALLVNELVSNAFKYAFVSRESGTVAISLKQKGKEIEIVVKDDGIGLPDFVNIEDRTSVSFLLMNTYAKQLNASYDVQTDPGTQFTFRFPNVDRKGSAGDVISF